MLLTGIAWFATWPGALGVSGTLGERLGPDEPSAGELLQAGGDSAAVATAFARSAGARSGVARIYVNRGEWLRLRGDLSAAEEDLEQAIALDPDDPAAFTAARRDRSWARRSGGTLRTTIGRGRSIQAMRRPHARPRTTLGSDWGAPHEAERDLEAALSGPDSAAAHDALGVALALKATGPGAGCISSARWRSLPPGRSINSIAGWRSPKPAGSRGGGARSSALLALDPAYHRARLGLAVLYRDRGDRARARAQVDTVLALAPADPDARALAAELAPGR